MKRYRIHIKHTLATLTCEEQYLDTGLKEITKQRRILEKFIEGYPVFAQSFIPVDVSPDDPEIVLSMAEASALAGVGPMAAVAGAIAELTVAAMVKAGARHVVMDNGGDIAMKINQPVVVGIYSGKSRINDIGFQIMPREGILGICTSSGTLGHSISQGSADSVTVISPDVVLADAVATSLGNHIQHTDKNHIENSLKKHLFDPVSGILVAADDVMAWTGDLPRMVKTGFDVKKINMDWRQS